MSNFPHPVIREVRDSAWTREDQLAADFYARLFARREALEGGLSLELHQRLTGMAKALDGKVPVALNSRPFVDAARGLLFEDALQHRRTGE